jgi:hypothetical protein
LVTEGKENGIKVDYDLDVTEVYLNVVTSVIERPEFLDMLSVPQSTHNHLVLPSWVPDWSTIFFPLFTLQRLVTPSADRFYQASRDTTSYRSTTILGDVLAVQGFTFDIINEFGSVKEAWENHPRGENFIRPFSLLLTASIPVHRFSRCIGISRCGAGR